MTIVCKNCGNKFEGNFCNNCGQKADVQKLDFQYVKNRLKKLFFKYFDKGILYTCGQLYTRPGDTIREYVEGKRVKHFEPLSLLLTLAALYAFFYHYFDLNFFSEASLNSDPELQKINFKDVNDWFSNHFALVSCLSIPIYSIGSFIVFRKQDYNFVEHLTLNTFLASQRLLLRIATLPLLISLNGTEQMQFLERFYIFLDIVLLCWSYSQFFNKLPKVKAILLTLLSYLIFFICFVLVVMFLLFLWKMVQNS